MPDRPKLVTTYLKLLSIAQTHRAGELFKCTVYSRTVCKFLMYIFVTFMLSSFMLSYCS